MYPVLFEIPGLGFPIRTFGVLVAVGFLLSLGLWGKFLRRYGVDPERDPERGSQVAMWVLVGVLGGARLAYVGVEVARYLRADPSPAAESYLGAADRARVAAVLSPRDLEAAQEIEQGYDFLRDPLRILYVWQGGLVMYGGFLGAVVLGLYAARKQGMHGWNAADTGLVCGFFGQALGRWGCLFVGDDHGSVVPKRFEDLPFPVTVRVPALEWLEANPESLFPHELAGKVLWGTQPWMSVNALMIALVGWFVLHRSRRHGLAAAWIVFHYAVTRFAIEAFRGDDLRGVWFDGALSTSQLLSIPVGVLGLVLLWRRGRRPQREEWRSWPP